MSPDRRGKALDVGLDIATSILDVSKTALELAPVPGLPLIAEGLSTLVDRVKDARENDDTGRAFLAEVKTLDTILMKTVKTTRAAVEDAGDEHAKKAMVDGIKNSEDLNSRVQELLSVIQDLEKDAKKLKGGPGVCGFFKGIIYSSQNKATLSDMKDSLANAIRNFQLREGISIENILNGLIQTAKEIVEGQKEIRRAQKEAEEKEVLGSILRADAGYRCVDELKSEFLAGTREDLFKELALWSSGNFPPDARKRFYFLSGGAGLGKSSIAHQLCTRLDISDKTALGASFFFLRGREDLESTRLFFSTLAYQLAISQPTLRPHIISAAREYLTHGARQQMKYAFQELLRGPFAGTSIVTQKPVVIVVDALDECKERDLVVDLVKLLLELISALSWIRVFVTSRPEPHIMSVFTSAAAAAVVHHRSLEDTLAEGAADVGKYLKETLSEMPPYNVFVQENPIFLKRLIERAGALFIYARTAVKFLDTYRDHPKPQEQFDLLLSSVKGARLSSLDNLYLQILLSAFPQDDLISSRQAQLLSFLTFVVLQREPLTPETMASFGLGLSKEDIVWMTDRLRSVLLIDNEGGVVPLHATFGEFLRDPKRCIDPLYHINPSKGHAQLASACLAALTFENMSHYLLDLNSESSQDRYVDYARLKWDVHLRLAEFNDELKLRLRSLIGAQMPVFMRAPYRASMETRGVIEKWFKGSEDAAEISLDYSKSAAYSRLWWERVSDSLDLRTDTGVVSPNISADDITTLVLGLDEEFYKSERLTLDLPVTGSDIARYRAAHEELVKQVWDAGVQELWFPFPETESGSSESDGESDAS
ncbi:hypothetical protein B0H13DRAFT_2305416 [Mycena leptocephala]|nr:hypothetical protein B0H13DRAFT_2305416 [Mycena leptocephala]